MFTKIGVPQKDEEEQIKKQFKMQAEHGDQEMSSDDADDFLKVKKREADASDSEGEASAEEVV